MTTKKRQKAQDVLFAVFASVARIAVLKVFVLDPMRAYYQRQIEGATGLPIRAIQRELDRFAAVGFLYRRAEGNRTYYQADTQFELFPELRSMIMKMGEPEERLRGQLAMEGAVRLAFLNESEGKVLVVTSGGESTGAAAPDTYVFEIISMAEFARALSETPQALEPYLTRGVDVLGRRDDVIWRRIEAAGFNVNKGKGVP